jgi:hypothetical protein
MVNDHRLTASEEGGVVLDIGGEIGAAVVRTPESLVGSELEICARDGAWDGTHVAVRERHTPDGTIFAALFFGLRQGNYKVRVRGDDVGPVVPLEVKGGNVIDVYQTFS